MGTYFSGIKGGCMDWCRTIDEKGWKTDEHSMERKMSHLEQIIQSLESRLNILDESNKYLFQKEKTLEEKQQQSEGELRLLMSRCRSIESRMDVMATEHQMKMDDAIIIMEDM